MKVLQQDILRHRLRYQRLVGPPFVKPEDAVDWLVAVQSQDYAGARWATWRRLTAKGATQVQTRVRRTLDTSAQAAVRAAGRRYERFMGLAVSRCAGS
jgi:hypothetical protein